MACQAELAAASKCLSVELAELESQFDDQVSFSQ